VKAERDERDNQLYHAIKLKLAAEKSKLGGYDDSRGVRYPLAGSVGISAFACGISSIKNAGSIKYCWAGSSE